jgi:Right handed beta helix region
MNASRIAVGVAGVLATLTFVSSASAQATRTWVSGVGDDANPCSRTAPCKTFAGAISKTAVAGEIDTLDPGGFGAVTITKSITIDATAGLGGISAAATTGIIVNAAAADAVVILRNLDIDGMGTGIYGIRILAARDVYVENSKIFGFTNRGITDERTAGRLFVADSVISNNAQTAIVAAPAAASTLTVNVNRCRLERNANSGFAATQGTKATIVNTTASGNTNFGFYADGAGSEVNLESSRATGNGTGLVALTSAVFRISNTTVTGNGTGLNASGGSILSYRNNQIDGNGTGNGPPTGTLGQQ